MNWKLFEMPMNFIPFQEMHEFKNVALLIFVENDLGFPMVRESESVWKSNVFHRFTKISLFWKVIFS